MGELIEVDFERGERLHGVDEFDGEVAAMIEEYHECCREGSVEFNAPLMEEGFAELFRAVFG